MLEYKAIQFPPSPSKDVVNYILYIESSPNVVTYDSLNFNIGKNTLINLTNFVNTSGTYNIGIVAQDEVGNLSSIVTYDNITIKEVSTVTEEKPNKKLWWIFGSIGLLLLIGLGFLFFVI